MTQAPKNSKDVSSSDHLEKRDRKSERAEKKERSEALNDLKEGSLNNEVIQQRQRQFQSGKSGVTGQKFASAKSLLGDNAHGAKSKESERKSSFSLGVDFETNSTQTISPDARSAQQKLADFMAAATKRASDPEGWMQWIQTESEKIGGIFEGLNEAKEETKGAMAAGWKAVTDGSLAQILSHPDTVAIPAVQAMSGAIDAASKDPALAIRTLEHIGNAVLKANNDYTNMSNHDKGLVIGKTMFFMINPEGSTEGAEVALKVADKVATKVDKVVMQTIEHSVKIAENSARTLPETARETKQMLLAYLQSKSLNSAEMELAGVPKGFFDGVKPVDEAMHILKMEGDNAGSKIAGTSSEKLLSQTDEVSSVLKKTIPDAKEKSAALSVLQDFPERQQLIHSLAELSKQSKIDLEFALSKCDLKHLQDYERSAHNLNFLKGNPIKGLSPKDNLLLQREVQKHMDNLADAVKRNAPEKEIASLSKRLKGSSDYIEEFKVQEVIIFEAGIHKVSLAEVARQFTYNEQRQELFNGLRQLALDLKKAGCETLYLDGSFITGKKIPGDLMLAGNPSKEKVWPSF